jgi:alginate biosynthesis protein AlgX
MLLKRAYLMLVLFLGFATAQICPEVSAKSRSVAVLGGQNGWLFGDQELAQSLRTDFVSNNMAKLRDALANRGIELVLVPVAARPMLYAQEADVSGWQALGWEYSLETAKAEYTALIAALRAKNVMVVDGLELAQNLEASGTQFFYKGDAHWTPEGAKATAQAVAELVKAQSTNFPGITKATFTTQQAGVKKFRGGYRGLVIDVCAQDIPAEENLSYQTTLSSEVGLFGDVESSITLVGTSFSKRDAGEASYNFDGFLSESLEASVFNAAVSGGGTFSAMEAYLQSDEFAQAPPKIIVWEYPVRDVFATTWEFAFRQMNAFLYGDCSVDAAKQVSAPRETSLPALMHNSVAADAWQLSEGATLSATSATEVDTETQLATMTPQGSLVYTHALEPLLPNQAILLSAVLWSKDEKPLTVTANFSSGEVRARKNSFTLTTSPKLYNFLFVPTENQRTTLTGELLVRLGSEKAGTFLMSAASLTVIDLAQLSVFNASDVDLTEKPYLVLEVADKTLTNFYLLEGLTNGAKLQTIDRDRWPVNSGKIFLELHPDMQSLGLLPMYQSLTEPSVIGSVVCKR